MEKISENILFTNQRPDLVMAKGKGVWLWDEDGKKYLDLMGGWAVTALGHCPKVIEKALSQQARKLICPSPSFWNRSMLDLAKKLCQLSGMEKVWFANSGAEANECAIKLARKWGAIHKKGAYKIVSLRNSFHGRTLACMSLSGKANWQKMFEPKVPGFCAIPMNDYVALDKALTKDVCAFFVEPIQGEGGAFPLDKQWFQYAEKLCRERKILLICDEIQTGMGRIGEWFAFHHYGIKPDIVTVGKGLGGGFPVSACLCTNELNILEQGEQGGTFSGQPLGMAVALAVIQEMKDANLLVHVQKMGNILADWLKKWEEKGLIKNPRGKGLLQAYSLADSKNSSDIVSKCLIKGLLINAPNPSTIRLVPPLIISEKELEQGLGVMEGVLSV